MEDFNMEFIIKNLTDKEIDILEREDFYSDFLDIIDVVIDGNREYINKVLKTIVRK